MTGALSLCASVREYGGRVGLPISTSVSKYNVKNRDFKFNGPDMGGKTSGLHTSRTPWEGR